MIPEITIRPIELKDNVAVKQLVLHVLKEFGAEGEGFASADPELECMYETYKNDRSAYWVVELDGEIVGGAGIGPLKNEVEDFCELQKMYFLPQIRGFGIGRQLIKQCLKFAQSQEYKKCYLETLPDMKPAQKLYQQFGFQFLNERMGGTGHSKCPIFMLLEL